MKSDGAKQDKSDTAKKIDDALSKYTVDLSALAERGEIDPVIGRDKEVRRVLEILGRKKKNNPVLIGEPGVGKTAVVPRTSAMFLASGLFFLISCQHAAESPAVYEIDGKVISLNEANELSKAALEKVRFAEFQIFEKQAHQAYVKSFFAGIATTRKISEQEARKQYIAEQVTLSGLPAPTPQFEGKVTSLPSTYLYILEAF